MVSLEVGKLLGMYVELVDRFGEAVTRQLRKRGELLSGDILEDVRRVRLAELASMGDVTGDSETVFVDYMAKSLGEVELTEQSSYEGILMSYENVRKSPLTDRVFLLSGRDVEKDSVYLEYLTNTFVGKLDLEKAETLGLMLENYVLRVEEDVRNRENW